MSMVDLSPNIAFTSVLDLKEGKFDMYDIKPTYCLLYKTDAAEEKSSVDR